MDQLTALLPLLLQHKQAANAVQESSIWDSLKSQIPGMAPQQQQVAAPANTQLPPPVAPIPVMDDMTGIPAAAPAIAPALASAGMDVPVNGSEKGGMMDFLKDPNMARALLMAGASQLSGESFVRSAGLGFGTYDTLKARDIAAEKASRDEKVEQLKLKNTLANDAASRSKDKAQSGLYAEQAATQISVRDKNKADAQKAKAEATKAIATAKKVGMETDKLSEPDTGLMQEIAMGLGYSEDEQEDGKYLQDGEFLRTYNSAVANDNAKIYNKFTADEKAQLVENFKNEEHPWQTASHEEIMETMDLEGIYSPQGVKDVTKYIQALVARRDKLKTQKAKNNPTSKPKVKTGQAGETYGF